MSLLLDALNKADQERKRNETTPGISSNHEQRVGDEESRSYSVGLIVAGVIGLGLLLAVIYWLGQRSTATMPNPAPAPTAYTNAATASTPAINQRPPVINNPRPATKPYQTETNPTVGAAANSDENVANLYQQNTEEPPASAAPAISDRPSAPAQNVMEPNPVTPENVTSPISIVEFANLPELHALPNNILDKIPTLTYSEHNYSVNGGSVKINGSIYHVNEQIADGIVIDKILEDGMILHIDNHSFKMRAMNSWINM